MKNKIKYLILSDIHLGHPRNHTRDILNNLDIFFKEHRDELSDIDMLIIAGDTFDRLLSTRSEEYKLTVLWLSNLLIWCQDNNVIFRILYGTPSHDNDQVDAFTKIAKTLAPKADYKYVNSLSIEHIKKLGITILYVPDEWKPKADETYNEVKQLLKDNNLAQVDIAIMHGCFRFQLPFLKDAPFTHKETNYLDIVKYYISIGHVHTANAYERIIVPGSFDRLTHGEEEKKGGLLCNIFKDGTMDFKFLENKHSKIFKTYDYRNIEESKIIKQLNKDIKKLNVGSYVRVYVDSNTKLIKNLRELVSKYQDIYIKFKTDNKVIKNLNILDTIKTDTFEITKRNIEELMLKEIGTLEPNDIKIFKEELLKAI